MDSDDIAPPRPVLEPIDLQAMSIEELRKYVCSLEHEISRAEKAITKKESHRDGADNLFNIG